MKILIVICKSNAIIVHQKNNLYVYTFFDATQTNDRNIITQWQRLTFSQALYHLELLYECNGKI